MVPPGPPRFPISSRTFAPQERNGMTDEERKAERHFKWQVIRESVERMKPELSSASEAAQKAKDERRKKSGGEIPGA